MNENNMISIFCPVYEATIFCGSIILEKISKTTQFIICCIGENRDMDKVDEVIQMGETLVHQELAELVEKGIATSNENKKWILTDVGREYFLLINIVNELADKGVPCLVNQVNENIYLSDRIKLYEKGEIESSSFILKSRISDVLLIGNDNYSNSLNILNMIIDTSMLSTDFKDDLYAKLQIKRSGVKYIRFDSCYENCLFTDEISEGITVGVPYIQKTYEQKYTQLDPYRDIKDALMQLKNFDLKLISAMGNAIINQFEKEVEKSYWFNQYTKRIASSEEIEQLGEENDSIVPIFILPRKDITIRLDKLADKYRYEHVASKDIQKLVKQTIKWESFVLENNPYISLKYGE